MTERHAWEHGTEHAARLGREAAIRRALAATTGDSDARRPRKVAADVARRVAARLVRLADTLEGRRRPRLT